MALFIPDKILPYVHEIPSLASEIVDGCYFLTPLSRETVDRLLAAAAIIEGGPDADKLRTAASKLKIQAVLLSAETREYLEELGLGLAPCRDPAPSAAHAPASVVPPSIRPLSPVSALVLADECKIDHHPCKDKCGTGCDAGGKTCCGHRCPGHTGCRASASRCCARGCAAGGHNHDQCHAAFRKRYAELKDQYARRHTDLKETYERKYAHLKAQYADRELEIKCKYDERHQAIKTKFNDLKKRYEARRCSGI